MSESDDAWLKELQAKMYEATVELVLTLPARRTSNLLR